MIFPIKEYKKVVAVLEDIEDVRLYNKAKNRTLQFVPAEEAFKTIERNEYWRKRPLVTF